jgi:hypothetical protein
MVWPGRLVSSAVGDVSIRNTVGLNLEKGKILEKMFRNGFE